MTIKIKFDVELMQVISLFERITQTNAKDCFKQDKRVVFIVNPGMAGKAVGKKGMNIRKLERMLNKKVKIVEYDTDLLAFVKNAIHPIEAKDIKEEGGRVIITPMDSLSRGYLIGREAVNLRAYEEIVKRYFDIKEIKVI